MALALVVTLSCQKQDGTGRLVFSLTEGDVAEAATKGNVSDYASLPSSDSFSLTVKDSRSTTVFTGTVGSWDPSKKLASGNYSAEVSYGSDSEEGPAKPYFSGAADFAVKSGTTEVAVPVTLGNAIVKIVTTDNFKHYYPTSSFTVDTPDNSFVWNGTPLFVAYQFSVSGTVTSQTGKTFSLETKSWKGEAATCYTVKYDVSNIGGVTVSVSFSDSVETVNLGEIELND